MPLRRTISSTSGVMCTISYRSSVWKVRYSVCALMVAINSPLSLKCYRMQECITLLLFNRERKVPQRKLQVGRLKRPTLEMKKALHRFASLLCLLTLLFNVAACLHAEQAKQSSCSHCPKPAPQSHTVPSCCAAQQQP